MKNKTKKIFSGEYSRDMWDVVNGAGNTSELRDALYFVCCRIQELESRVTNTDAREIISDDCDTLQARLTLTANALAAARKYLETLEAETDGTDFIPYGKAEYHVALARIDEATE